MAGRMITPGPDVLVLAAGSALTAGMLAFMLRREPVLAAADDAGLHVAARVVPWRSVRRLQYGRGGDGTWLRVHAADGVVELRDVDLLQPAETLRRAIVERAGLEARPDAVAPRGVGLAPGDDYAEWARPGLPAEQVRPPEPRGIRWVGNRGLLGALLAVAALLAKFGKVLLLGGVKFLKLGKVLPTLLTMLATAWLYAQVWGWWFAAGFVALILLHELGHAAVIRAKGLRMSPIVFIPFVGAFIAIKDQFRDARTEAEVGYGGPAAGTLAASACFAAYLVTGHGLLLGLAYVGFLLNLFNLLPVSPLDGGRVVTAISPWLWLPGLLGAGALGAWLGSPLLLVVVVLGALRAWEEFRRLRRGERVDYYRLTPGYRAAVACGYFGLCGYLGWMTLRALELGGHA
jgi:Zn-dependent protease